MKIWIGSDHAGVKLKEQIKDMLLQENSQEKMTLEDVGPFTTDSVDYPDFAQLVCARISQENPEGLVGLPLGILICGSGVGISIAANRFAKIRAALAESETVAKLSREHNHANVLCLGANIISTATAFQIIRTFLTAKPDQGERHLRRIQKLSSQGLRT